MFAQPIVVSPMGVFSILVNTVGSAWFLNERLSSNELASIMDCVLGVFFIIVYAPPVPDVNSFGPCADADAAAASSGRQRSWVPAAPSKLM